MIRLIQVLVLIPLLLLGQENLPINLDENQFQHIIGGEEASITDYPWQVALVDSNGLGFCGGVIISDSWIVTAAHCLDPSTNEDNSELFLIRAGSSSVYASGGNEYLINNTITHPDYSSSSLNNDIALVQIDGIFNFNQSIQPILIADSNQVEIGLLDHGTPAVISGWGDIEWEGFNSDTLLFANTFIVSNSIACGDSIDENGNYGFIPCNMLSDGMICAGIIDSGGVGTCQGDSGGPLVVFDLNNIPYLVGITSFGVFSSSGSACGDQGYPSVYAKVSYYFDWIFSNANLDIGCTDSLYCNFSTYATFDDGSCMNFDECGDCGGNGPNIGFDCSDNCLVGDLITINMFDSSTNGWQGISITVGEIENSLENGGIGSVDICLDLNECNSIIVSGGEFEDEVSWAIGSNLFGGAPFIGEIGNCGGNVEEIYGCTDSTATNYNPLANTDDGTCEGGCVDQDDLIGELIQNYYPDLQLNCMSSIATLANILGADCTTDISFFSSGLLPMGTTLSDVCECSCYGFDLSLVTDEMVYVTPKLIKVIDLLGREYEEPISGIMLFYIYDNGKVEKKFIF